VWLRGLSSRRVDRRLERLRRIINLCRAVEEGVDPFSVDVGSLLSTLREIFPELKNPEELCLDVEAVDGVSSIVKRQGDWVKSRSTTLYRDPFLLIDKLRRLGREALAEMFLEVWRPVVELEQITPHSLEVALRYWGGLAPLSERWRREEAEAAAEAGEFRVLTEDFEEELEALWAELRERAADKPIDYWDFVVAETYEKTIRRAYITSFLITYGYAKLEVYPLEERMQLRALRKPRPRVEGGCMMSIPIPISFEEWRRRVAEGKP